MYVNVFVSVCDNGTYLTVIRQYVHVYEEAAAAAPQAAAVVVAAAAYGLCIIVIDVRHF